MKESKGTPFARAQEWAAAVQPWVTIFATVAVPLIVWWGTNRVQQAVAEQSIAKDYVALAIEILKDPSAKSDAALRRWAVDIVQQNAPVKIPGELRTRLLSGESALPEVPNPPSGIKVVPN